jgi:predicted O-methyltransferase YrrM
MWPQFISGKKKTGTRLHNHAGRFMDAAGLVYLPHSILTTLSVKLTGRYAELPLLSFRGIKALDRLIQKDWKILEFGSGMSTLWFARRCALLVSVECFGDWHGVITQKLAERGLQNVDYRLSEPATAHVIDEYPDSYFDLVLIDGVRRQHAMMTAISKVKPGGYIYLDGTDVQDPEFRTARAMLLKVAGPDSNIKVFNDLSPSRVYVTEGMLARVANKPS